MANIKGGHKGGRPTKLTDELTEELCRYLRLGNYIETACKLVGLSKRTFHFWVDEARKAQRNTNRYAKFLRSVEKAMAEAETVDVARIAKAAEKQWQASAWRLERKYPQRWGKKDFITTSEIPPEPDEDKPGEMNMAALTSDELSLIENANRKAYGLPPLEDDLMIDHIDEEINAAADMGECPTCKSADPDTRRSIQLPGMANHQVCNDPYHGDAE